MHKITAQCCYQLVHGFYSIAHATGANTEMGYSGVAGAIFQCVVMSLLCVELLQR